MKDHQSITSVELMSLLLPWHYASGLPTRQSPSSGWQSGITRLNRWLQTVAPGLVDVLLDTGQAFGLIQQTLLMFSNLEKKIVLKFHCM